MSSNFGSIARTLPDPLWCREWKFAGESLQSQQVGNVFARADTIVSLSFSGVLNVPKGRGPFPAVPLVAVGGVDAELAPEYLRAGAIAVGVGSPLFGDAGRGGDPTPVTGRAQAFVTAVEQS